MSPLGRDRASPLDRAEVSSAQTGNALLKTRNSNSPGMNSYKSLRMYVKRRDFNPFIMHTYRMVGSNSFRMTTIQKPRGVGGAECDAASATAAISEFADTPRQDNGWGNRAPKPPTRRCGHGGPFSLTLCPEMADHAVTELTRRGA